MKKIFLIIPVLFLSISLWAQDIYAPTADLTESEKAIITNAQKDITRGDQMVSTADGEYNKYSSLVNSDKKSKKNKGEKKLVPAKRNLLTASTYYQKGYTALYNLYVEKLQTVEFIFQDDQKTAKDLMDEAEKKYNEGKSSLSKIPAYTDKQLDNDVKYATLCGNIKKGSDNEKIAVEKLAEALGLYDKQIMKQADLSAKDKQSWQNALMENSISGYKKYKVDFPNGLYIGEANTKILELEEKIKIAEQQQNDLKLVYHIQILADEKRWAVTDVQSHRGIYEPVTEKIIEGPNKYKYWVGNYTKYDDAKAAAKKLKKGKSKYFVIAEINGNVVDIKTAINVEKNKK